MKETCVGVPDPTIYIPITARVQNAITARIPDVTIPVPNAITPV